MSAENNPLLTIAHLIHPQCFSHKQLSFYLLYSSKGNGGKSLSLSRIFYCAPIYNIFCSQKTIPFNRCCIVAKTIVFFKRTSFIIIPHKFFHLKENDFPPLFISEFLELQFILQMMAYIIYTHKIFNNMVSQVHLYTKYVCVYMYVVQIK